MDYLQDKIIKTAYKILKDQGATEVYLFGSRVRGDLGPNSDFDFGVKGFPSESFFSTIVDLEYATKARIDLIDFDSQSDFFEHLVNTNSVVKLEAS